MSDNCTSMGVCSNLPAQGNRISATPSGAPTSFMATIMGANSMNAPTVNVSVTSSGAHYYWLGPGLEITGPADGTTSNQLGVIQDDNPALNLISNIVVDRDYVHCAAAQDCTRMWAFTGAMEAGVDSIFSGAHSLISTQSQAVWGENGYGPYKFVNNYIAGASEPFFTGGSGCPPTNVIPSDFEIAGNYLTYDYGSRASTFLNGTNAGNIRAIMELKQGQRFLIQGNILDATPVSTGSIALNYGFLPRTALSGGACSWLVTQDVTFRFNWSIHSTVGLSMQGGNDGGGHDWIRL